MPTAAELGDAFYSGSLFGRTPDTQSAFAGQAASYLNRVNPTGTNSKGVKGGTNLGSFGTTSAQAFNEDAYQRATKAGYSDNDINAFLRDSGVRAEGSRFGVAGTGTYGGREASYFQVTPAYKPPTATDDNVTKAPDYGNKVLETIQLPNNGIGTIESISKLPESVSASAPILGDPLGEGSQRVSRQKARLSIAK